MRDSCADRVIVETLYPFQAPVNVGDQLTIVDASAEVPRALIGTCQSASPLMVELGQNPGFGKGTRVLAVLHEGNQIIQTYGTVVATHVSGSQWILELNVETWSEIDRRAHPRTPVDLAGGIAFVQDANGELQVSHVDGRFKDLSVCGGWIEASVLEPRGALVNWHVKLPSGEVARGIALVARACPIRGGMGLEFIDFAGQSSTHLRALLQKAA